MAKATETIAWLSVPADEDVSAEARELWEKPLEKLGFVPNVLRVMALRPEHLVTWWAYMQELMTGESGLTKAQREMIAVVVSVENRCHYCVVSHSAALRKLTGDPIFADQIATNYRYAPLELGERAMLDYAVRLTTDSSACTEDDVRGVAGSRLERRGHSRHRPGRGDVQFHKPARERSRLGSKSRVLRSRSLIACRGRGRQSRTSGRMVVRSCEHP